MPSYRDKRIVFACSLSVMFLALGQVFAQTSVPEKAMQKNTFGSKDVSVHQLENTLWLSLGEEAMQQKKAIIPRLCAPIRSIRWKDDPDAEIKFTPEPGEWLFAWKAPPKGAAIIEVVFDRAPVLPADFARKRFQPAIVQSCYTRLKRALSVESFASSLSGSRTRSDTGRSGPTTQPGNSAWINPEPIPSPSYKVVAKTREEAMPSFR